MSESLPEHSLQLKSRINASGTLDLILVDTTVPKPGPDDVIVRMEAAPINPSDLGVMINLADLDQASAGGTSDRPALSAPMPGFILPRLKVRHDKALAVGNEGAGTVIAAGSSPAAQSLIGKVVAVFGGAMYQQYRCINIMSCLPMKDGTTAEQAASGFVNPMTALSMVETMKMEGHSALVHTAAASNLGQMLNRICQADDVKLVNIVRKAEQADLLRGAGAAFVCNSSEDDFKNNLTDALVETGATLAFDAIGGGSLASDILDCMEQALNRTASEYSIYGSETHKQIYLYGSLDMAPTVLNRAYGMSWSVGGWLLPRFLARLGMEGMVRLRTRVADEITTTFASHYKQTLSLTDVMNPDIAREYNAKRTGEKYLINPNA